MYNDSIHKFAYRHPDLFADLLRLIVPALAPELDFAAAKEISAAHVGHHAGVLEQRRGDMTWRVPLKAGALKDGSRPYLLVLLEFQSTVDRAMARRMRNYGTMLRERLAADGTAEREGGLPWLLPIVLYNGTERWTATGFGAELAAMPSAMARRTLALYQPEDYFLISLERLLEEDRNLQQLPSVNRAAATLRLQTGQTLSAIEHQLRTEWARFPGTANEATRRVLRVWAEALVADIADDDEAAPNLPSFEELEGLTEESDMTTISQARLGKWYREYRAANVAIGVRQERQRTVAMMGRQATIKFGAQTADSVVAILGAHPPAARVEQFAIAVVECDSGDEFLARFSEAGT